MNIKKLLIMTVFVVGLAPNNARSGGEYCAPCGYRSVNPEDPEGVAWNRTAMTAPSDDENDENEEALLREVEERLEERYPAEYYEKKPAQVKFRDQYAPCDTQFQEKVETEEEQGKPYVIIYRVK